MKLDKWRINLKTDHRNSLLATYTRMVEDSDIKERWKASLCQVCFYAESRIAGQAFTSHACEICDKPMQFSSTDVNVLCKGCAKLNTLCVHCGCSLRLTKPLKEPVSSRQSHNATQPQVQSHPIGESPASS